jgi:hypothetical protein
MVGLCLGQPGLPPLLEQALCLGVGERERLQLFPSERLDLRLRLGDPWQRRRLLRLRGAAEPPVEPLLFASGSSEPVVTIGMTAAGLDSSLGSRLTHGAPLAFQNHEGGVTRNVDMVRDRDLVRPRDCAIPCLGWYGCRGRRASAVGALQFRWHVSRLPLLLRPDARASRAEVQSPRRCSTPGGAPRVRTSPSS